MAKPLSDEDILAKKPNKYWGMKNLEKAIELYHSHGMAEHEEKARKAYADVKQFAAVQKAELYRKRIEVCCTHCQTYFDENEIGDANIVDFTTEDYMGREADVVIFKCPKCGKETRSFRMG